MASEPHRCALPGCDVLIDVPEDGSAPRKYCCTEHRFAARRMRSTARATTQPQESQEDVGQAAPAQSTTDADADWRSRVRAAIDRAIRGLTTLVPSDNGLFDPNASTGLSATTPVERVIPELNHLIDGTVIANVLRRRRRPARRPVRRGPHRTPRKRAGNPPRKPVARRTSALPNPTKRPPITVTERRLRRRAGLVAAVIGFVATGAWLVTMHPWTTGPGSAPSTAHAQLPQVPTLPANGDQWAGNAQLALTSVDQQLAEATKAEHAWQSSPAARQQQAAPPAVANLQNQISALQQEHDQLQSALNTWRAATQAHDALAATGAQYGAIVQTSNTSTVPVAGPREPAPTTTQSAATQAQSLASQAATQRQQLDSLLPQVQSNLAAPLPSTVDNVSALANSVLDLTRQQPQPATQPTTAHPAGQSPPKPSPTRPTEPPASRVPAPSTTTRAPNPTELAPQPAPTNPAPVEVPTQPAPAQPIPARPVTLVPVLVPNPPATNIAPVVTKPTVPMVPIQPTVTAPQTPVSQSESDSLAALRDIEAMSTLAAAAQQAPEGSAQQRQLTEQAAAGITQAMDQHLPSLIADAAAANVDNTSSGDTSVNSSGDSYGADGANAG